MELLQVGEVVEYAAKAAVVVILGLVFFASSVLATTKIEPRASIALTIAIGSFLMILFLVVTA